MSKTYSAGIVTAYGAAKRAGYQGTYEDFCRQQAGYAESAAAVEQAKNTAVSAANTATTKAGEAATAATAAQTAKTQTEQSASQALTDIAAARSGAISAVQTEGTTQTANARAQAQAAAQSATTASTKASEASSSATSAGQSATNAAASATSAANSASAAQAVKDSIPQDYSDLSAEVSSLNESLDDVKADLHTIFTTTKNLLDCEFANAIIFNNGVYSESELPKHAAEEAYIEVESEKDYVFSWNAVSSVYPTLYVSEYASDKSFIKRTSLSTRSYPTVKTTATTKYVRLYFFEANATSWQSLVPTDFQMEEGTTPTAYVAPKQIKNECVGDLPYVAENQGIENAGKTLVVGNDGTVGLATASAKDTALSVKTSDIALMASINHSLRLPTDIAGVDVHSTTGWTGVDATVSIVENVYDPVNRIYRDCIEAVSTANGIVRYELGQSIDATKKPLLVSIGFDPAFTLTNGRNVNIVLYSGSGRTNTYKAELSLQWEGSNASFISAYCMNGFFNLCLFTDTGKYASKGTGFDATNITAIGLHIYHASGTSRKIYIADMKFVEPMQKGGIVTIIDNFGTQVPAMADYAYSKGVRLNLSIIPGFYEGSSLAPICASKSELDRVAQQGHFIWNHTYEHIVFNNLTDKQIADEINLAEKWMYINGYGRGAKFVSVPSAKFNTDSFNSVVKTNANMIFHTWGYMGTWAYAPYYPCTRQLPTTILDSVTDHSASNLIAQARKGFDNGGISVVGFHGAYWDNDNGDSWKAYIDGISAIEGVYHYGLDEIFDGQWC